MAKRRNIPTETDLGERAGISRAVIVGNRIEVSATGAVDENGNIVGDDAATQTRYILEKIERVLNEAGAKLEDIVRVRKYVIDEAYVYEVADVCGEVFRNIKPASAMVVVKALTPPGLLLKIEAKAVVDD